MPTHKISRSTHITIRWACLLITLVVVAASLFQSATIKSAYADTGGYTWWDAPCAWNGDTTGSCSGYDWGESTCPTGDGYCSSGNEIDGYYQYDQWGEGFRNCTSYTAYMLNQIYGINVSDWENGANWDTEALGAGVGASNDSAAHIGDIAQYNATTGNPYGHVAYVYGFNGSGVPELEDYNYAETGVFSDSNTTTIEGTPSNYIKFGSAPSGTDLTQFYVSGGSWTAFDISAATGVPVTGNPTSNSGGELAQGAGSTYANNLMQYYVSDGAWTAFDISAATGVNIAGNPIIDSSGDIYARGTNNDLYQFYVSGSSWTAFNVSSAVGNIGITGDPASGNGADWAQGSGSYANKLMEFYVSGGSWTAFNVSNATDTTIGGDPILSSGGEWARGANNNLYQFYVSGSWTAFNVSSAVGGIDMAGDPSIGTDIWVQGSGSPYTNNLLSFYVSGGSWTHADVSSATGVNVASNPEIDSSGNIWAQDTSNNLDQFYVSGGSWTYANVSSAAGGVKISGDPGFYSGGELATSE